MTTEGSPPTWRAPVFYRIFFPALGLFFLFCTAAYFAPEGDLLMVALGLVMGLGLTIGPFRPVVRLEQQDVFARALIVSRRMPLRDIVQIEGGYNGLSFLLSDGRRFEATGVGEKFNITKWRGRRGKADSIADTIFAARERVLADVPEDQRPTKPGPAAPPPPDPTYVEVVQVVGTGIFLLGAYLAFISDTFIDAGLPLMTLGALGPVLLTLWSLKRNPPPGDSA
jgi:hypothetical protein